MENLRATELRIGNYVNAYSLNNPENCKIELSVITGLGRDIIEYDIISNKSFNHSNIEPIPLTKELLLKCGLKVNSTNDIFILIESGKMSEGISIREDNGFYLWCGDNYLSELEIKYLHQLQNIFLALTSQELKCST